MGIPSKVPVHLPVGGYRKNLLDLPSRPLPFLRYRFLPEKKETKSRNKETQRETKDENAKKEEEEKNEKQKSVKRVKTVKKKERNNKEEILVKLKRVSHQRLSCSS